MSTANKFYNIFWSNEQCRSIFLLHKEQLLEKQEIDMKVTKKHYYLPRFVLSNSIKRKEALARMEQRIQNRNIDGDHSFNTLLIKNIDEEKIVSFLKKKFGKPYDKISKKISSGAIAEIKFFTEVWKALSSEKHFISFLRKYDIIGKDIDSVDEIGLSIQNVIQKEILPLVNTDHFIDIFESFNEVSRFYDNYIFNNLIKSDKFYTDILYDSEHFKSRLLLFDSLYEANALIGGHYKAYYECTYCPVNTFSGNVTLNVTPGKIKLKCPNCGKEVFYLVPYKIHEDIFNHIQSKDGILFHAVASLLEAKRIMFNPNATMLNDVEIDFQILNKERTRYTDIVEIKMFKTDRPVDTTKNNLRDGFKKFLNARNKLLTENNGYAGVVFHYLTNITDHQSAQSLLSYFKDEVAGQNVHVHTLKSFHDYITTLSANYY